jgi:hypothetical protein
LALFAVVLVQFTLLTLGLGFAWNGQPPPPTIANLNLGLLLIGLSIALLFIGEKISPPDRWLDPWLSPFRGHKPQWKQTGPVAQEEGEIWATINVERPGSAPWRLEQGQRYFVEFNDGFMYLGQPGKELSLVEPKKILRVEDKTLTIDTGHWSHGEIILTFESASDADKVKRQIIKITSAYLFGHRHGQVPPTFPTD